MVLPRNPVLLCFPRRRLIPGITHMIQKLLRLLPAFLQPTALRQQVRAEKREKGPYTERVWVRGRPMTVVRSFGRASLLPSK